MARKKVKRRAVYRKGRVRGLEKIMGEKPSKLGKKLTKKIKKGLKKIR